ncbi:hypothetical protein K523DRAFT_357999 [Schizophyllum commune Tattone D]|nr:hypothetical protein K523DRAFT_357999 [Schizophyllum commune Tattone D]
MRPRRCDESPMRNEIEFSVRRARISPFRPLLPLPRPRPSRPSLRRRVFSAVTRLISARHVASLHPLNKSIRFRRQQEFIRRAGCSDSRERRRGNESPTGGQAITCAFVVDSGGSSTSTQRPHNLAPAYNTSLALVLAPSSIGRARTTSNKFNNEYPSGEQQYKLATCC